MGAVNFFSEELDFCGSVPTYLEVQRMRNYGHLNELGNQLKIFLGACLK